MAVKFNNIPKFDDHETDLENERHRVYWQNRERLGVNSLLIKIGRE